MSTSPSTAPQQSRELRFGVRLDDRYSQHWKVRAAASRRDVYVASQRTGRFLHVSLHNPSYGMHVRVTTPEGRSSKRMPYPDALVPGVTRLVQLRVPQAAVSSPAPTSKVARWIERPDDDAVWVAFEVLAEEPGAWSKEDQWNRGCTFVGRVPRADGGSVAVAAWLMTGREGSLTFDAGSKEAADAARATIAAAACVRSSTADDSLDDGLPSLNSRDAAMCFVEHKVEGSRPGPRECQ